MMVVLFSRNLSFQCWRKGRCSPNREIVHTSSKKEKRHLCPCLFTAFHNRNLMVFPPIRYSVLLLILLCVCVCVCVFTRLSFQLWVLFHTVVGFVLPMDWKSDRRGREGSQAVVGKGAGGVFDFKGSFLKFPLNLSVFACQVFLSSLSFYTHTKRKKRKLKGAKTGS